MLLVDTQVAIWLLAEHPALGRAARHRVETSPVVHISAATVWELEIKSMLGKVELPPGWPAVLWSEGYVELAVSSEHATAIREFPEIVRQDPFDRLLVAQAATTGMDFMTADRTLLRLGREFIVDARV